MQLLTALELKNHLSWYDFKNNDFLIDSTLYIQSLTSAQVTSQDCTMTFSTTTKSILMCFLSSNPTHLLKWPSSWKSPMFTHWQVSIVACLMETNCKIYSCNHRCKHNPMSNFHLQRGYFLPFSTREVG